MGQRPNSSYTEEELVKRKDEQTKQEIENAFRYNYADDIIEQMDQLSEENKGLVLKHLMLTVLEIKESLNTIKQMLDDKVLVSTKRNDSSY